MKRGYMGVYHLMGKQHLHRYCAEYGFRWNHRKASDQDRMDAAIMRSAGKRLLYEPLRLCQKTPIVTDRQ